jgi:hypothetical protein
MPPFAPGLQPTSASNLLLEPLDLPPLALPHLQVTIPSDLEQQITQVFNEVTKAPEVKIERKMVIIKRKPLAEQSILSKVMQLIDQARLSNSLLHLTQQAIEEFTHLISPNADQVNRVFTCFEKLNSQAVFEAYKKIQLLQLPTSVQTYEIILSACAKDGSVHFAKAACDSFMLMKAQNMIPSTQAVISFFNFFGRLADASASLDSAILEDVISTVEIIREHVEPSLTDVINLYKVYDKVLNKRQSYVKRFYQQIQEMKIKGVLVDKIQRQLVSQGVEDDSVPDLEDLSLQDKPVDGQNKKGKVFNFTSSKSATWQAMPSEATCFAMMRSSNEAHQAAAASSAPKQVLKRLREDKPE